MIKIINLILQLYMKKRQNYKRGTKSTNRFFLTMKITYKTQHYLDIKRTKPSGFAELQSQDGMCILVNTLKQNP